MADLKISQLNSIVTVVPATDVLPVVQGGTTLKITPNQILGAGGTATLASATITGDLTVDTSTLKVDSTNNRVGIGTASPQDGFEVVGNSFFRGAAAGVRVGDGGGYGYISAYGPALSGAKDLVFQTGGGNVGVGVTPAAGSGAIQLNAGVGFPATQVASADANCLDDYEEGTFTPTVIGSTIAGVGVYGSQVGRYTKVGNLVTLQVYLDWSAHTGTGDMYFGNFPFTTNSSSGVYGAATIGYVQNIALTASNILTGWANSSATSIFAYQTPVGGGSATPVPVDTSGTIIFSITYRV